MEDRVAVGGEPAGAGKLHEQRIGVVQPRTRLVADLDKPHQRICFPFLRSVSFRPRTSFLASSSLDLGREAFCPQGAPELYGTNSVTIALASCFRFPAPVRSALRGPTQRGVWRFLIGCQPILWPRKTKNREPRILVVSPSDCCEPAGVDQPRNPARWKAQRARSALIPVAINSTRRAPPGIAPAS